MLSIENPPPDPPCPFQISQLKSSTDERASHSLALQDVDLFSSSLDDSKVPNFSIRDYVFTARNKDIQTNWPFSQRNLQLCLKHGVKDPLPPFQSLDSLRKGSFLGCPVETSLLDEQNISNSNGEPSGSSPHLVPSCSDDAPWNGKLAAVHTGLNSCGSGGETDFPSTTITSNSQSEIIESVPVNRISSTAIKSGSSLEASVEAEGGGGPPASHKTENLTQQPSSKKCRLILKLSAAVSDPGSTEDIASNCTTLSEAMTSKLCPVCKTFSSSSNTTLNAHIDQCLSVESPSKWMPDSKLPTKYRVKPRKTRSMADICETAPRCTLEELDRRNGSSWATDSNLPAEVCTQGKKQRLSPAYPEDAGDEGAVYIDANGTKLRILSKFNCNAVGEDPEPRKSLKGVKRSKLVSSNSNKRRHATKHPKYLKLVPPTQKICSPKAPTSKIHGAQDGDDGVEETRDKEERLTQLIKPQGQIKPGDSGTLRQWVCSKRTGLSKKIKAKDGHQLSGCKLHMTRDLLVESDRSCLGDSLVEGNCVQEFPNSSENPISSPERHKRMGSSLYEAQANDNRKQSPGRKRVRIPLFGAQRSDNVERSLEMSKRASLQSSKDSTSVLKHSQYTTNHAGLLSNKTIEIHAGPVQNSDGTPNASTNPSRVCHAVLSNPTRFTALGKSVLSVSGSSVPEYKFKANKKISILKKSQVNCVEERGEEVAAWPSERDGQYDFMHNYTEKQSGTEEIIDKVSLSRSSVQEIRQGRGARNTFQREEVIAFKSSQVAVKCHGHIVGENIDSSVIVGDFSTGKYDSMESVGEEVQFQGGDMVIEQSSNTAAGVMVSSLSRSIDPEFRKRDNSYDTQSDSPRSFEEYNGPLCGAESPAGPTEPSSGDGREMFCADEVGNGILGQNTHMGAHLDSKVGQGNSFPEIDPIPIPGPPGSFLPSPGDTGSEDFQGNSSLTTSRVHSSQEQHDLVDGDSSDSPISATSSVSNFTAARSDLKYSEELFSIASHVVEEKNRPGFSVAGIEPVVENGVTVPQTASVGADRIILDGDSLKVKVISPEKGHLKFKDDNQPCCCSRKERVSQGVLNYQESQLLRRRTTASVMVPAMGKQMGCNPNPRTNNLNARPEMFSFSNCPSAGSEKLVLPVMKSSAGSIAMKGSSDAAVKFPSRGDSDSASPSASNPILRLMGKNLMVVSKDEDSSVHLKEAQPGAPNNCPKAQFLNPSGVSPGSIQNRDYRSFHHIVPQGSVNFGQDSHNTVGQCFDVRLNGFRGQVNSMLPEIPPQAQAGMLLPHMCSGLAASLELHEYKGEYNLRTQLSRPKNRLEAASPYNMEKIIRTPDFQCRNADSAGNPIKEIIIIDDAPESEADSTADDAKYTRGFRGSQVSSAGISIPAAPDYTLSHVNPYSCHQSQDPSPLGESAMVHNGSFNVSHSSRPNTSPYKWSCTSDGSGVLQQGPNFVASSPSSSSSSHLRSALYYSSSLS